MKNKREWKSLKRRGLAALLTLAMCLGTVPFTAFAAEDTHEHNQNGWNCEWVEPEQELNCQHEHDEDCYVPGEPVLECTDDHHDEDCYVPDEDVLTCENEDEDHEHDEDCYASGEDVLACDEDHEHDEDCYAPSEGVLECDEDHHTEDCYVSAEEVLDCRHEHAEDCFSAAEGFWSCTPPVEDTADEAGDDVIEEDQFDDDDNQGIIDEDEMFEDDDQTVVEDEGVFNDDEQQNDVEDEDEALIPDEVQAFLDAVAAIPEITPENAEEVAEYVYGEVSECYEALLGTEYEDREDVQEAVAVYAAAVEAVDAVLDMESAELASGYIPVENVGIYPDKKPTGTTANGKVRYSDQSLTMKVGQKASFLLGAPSNTLACPTHTYKVFAVYHPSDYCDISLIDNDNTGQGIVGNPTYFAAMKDGERVFDTQFEALKPGKSNDVRVCYYANFGIVFTNNANSVLMPCYGHYVRINKDITWYRYNDVFGITVNADYVLNYDANGGSVDPTFEKKTAASTACTFDLPTPIREGYTFKGWAESADAKTGITGSYTLEWSEGYGSADNPVSQTLYAVWEEDDEKPKTYTVIYTDGVPGMPPVFVDDGYEDLKAGDDTPLFNGNGEDPTRTGYTFTGWAPAWKATVDPDMADKDGVITYTATWEKKKLSKFTKELVETATDAPADVTGVTYPDANGKVIVPADGTPITLLYKITVTGEKGTPYEVTDEGAKWVSGALMKGTIPDSGKAVIYVTKSFTQNDIDEGYLYNVAKVVPGTNGGSNTTSLEKTPAEVEQKQEYTLKYDANGGEGAPADVTQDDAKFTISDTTPTKGTGKDSFVFAGWADSADAKKAQYQPGGEITLTKPEKTLYAVWAKISVTKTMKKTEGSVDDDKLRNGDTVFYTVAVTNTGNTPLNTLQFFDDMDLKLTKPTKITIDSGWNVISTYYPVDDSNEKPLLYIKATGNTLEVGESVVVQYEATIAGADGTKVINTVNVYAEIGEYVNAASRKMVAFRSDGPGGGASSEGETVGSSNVNVDDGTGERPKPPTGGVSGSGGTSTDTDTPPVVVPKPALSVTKTADPTTASVGDEITYTVTVENTGDVDLTGITITDTMAGEVQLADGNSFGPFDLAVKATKTITYTYKVTAEDAGKVITNTANVTSKEVTTPVQDSATVTVNPAEPEKVTITIEYVDEDGEPIGGTYTEEVEKGEYDVSDKIAVPGGYAIISIEGELKGTTDEDVTITVTCGEDKRGNDDGKPTDKPDGIPDAFQPIVTYIVTGGTWQEDASTVKEVVFNLVDEQGNRLAPTLGSTIPTPVVNAGTNTEEGADWVGTAPAADTEVTKDGATYTYVFPALEGMRTITVNRVHNGNTIVSIPVTVPDGEAYTVTEDDAPAAFNYGGNHYIRIDTLPTVPVGDEDVSIDVHYAIDNIGGGANGSSPDGIPDSQQAVVYYRSSNTAYGTVRDAYQMFDLRPDAASREETLRNAAATVGRARFTNWTMGGQALSTSATLENAFTVEAGHTYTVTANFTGYTGGGSGGGGGGGGSSSGNTNNNTNNDTNNDTTTNDDTVTINDTEVPLADLTSLNREDHFAYVSGYTDGTVRPTNNITREEVAAIFYRLLTDVSRTVYETGVNNFSDVDSSRWSNNAISTLANAGIISGYKEGTFKPGQTITRAEFAAIASRFDTVSENVTNPFTDTEGHWAEQLISNAADKGWVGGYPDSTFRPSNAITRAEAMTLINKVLNREVDKDGLLADAKQWPDNQEGKWYYYQVLEATNSHDYERRSADSYVENWTAITQK